MWPFGTNRRTQPNISAAVIVIDILPSTKTIASLNVSDCLSGKFNVQHFHHHATFTSTLSAGVEPSYNIASGAFTTKYTVGASLSKPEWCAAIVVDDKWNTLKASYVHHLYDKKISVVAEMNRRLSINKDTFTLGGLYTIDKLTSAKAKLNNHGKAVAVLQHEFISNTMVTIVSEFDVSALHKIPRFGLGLSYKPLVLSRDDNRAWNLHLQREPNPL